MDKIVSMLVGLGVPGIILLFVISATGLAGGAATVAALATLGGPVGMIGGIGVLGLMVLISQALSKYGFERIFRSVLRGLKEKGKSKQGIKNEIEKYPISKDLKLKLKHLVDHDYDNL